MAKRLTATEKLRSNIKRTIRRLERAGYEIPAQIKEKAAKGGYQTLKSLQRKRYDKLYKEVRHEYEDELLTGKEYKRKIREERKNKIEPKERTQDITTEEMFVPLFLEDYQAFYQGEIVYQNIAELIEKYSEPGSVMLSRLLQHEIEKYGLDTVLKNISQAPDEAIEMAQNIVFYVEDSGKIHSAMVEFANILRGTKATDDEAKELGDALDKMTNM